MYSNTFFFPASKQTNKQTKPHEMDMQCQKNVTCELKKIKEKTYIQYNTTYRIVIVMIDGNRRLSSS